MIKVIATLIAQDDKIDATRDALTALVAPTQAEAGCISYHLYQSTEDPTEFVTVEEWEDQAAIDNHFTTEHIGAALAAAPEILAADPKIISYTLVA